MRFPTVLREPVIAIAVLGFAIAASAAFGANAPAPKPAAPAAAPADGAKGATPPAAASSEAVARLDDTVITREELDDAARNMYQMYKQRMAAAGQAPQDGDKEPNDEQKRKILDSLINSKILDSLIKKSNAKVSETEAAERLKAIMDAQGVKSEADFTSLLQQHGMTLDQIKTQINEFLARQKYMETLTKDVKATDAEVEAAYNKIKSAEGKWEAKEDTLDVASILIRVTSTDESVWSEAKKKIDAIRDRVVQGKEDFLKVAQETSQDPEVKKNGGVYPLVTQKAGPFGPEFTAAAFALPDGEVSKPVRTKAGWCLLKVTAKRAPGPLLLTDPGVKLFVTLRASAQKSSDLLEKTIADARKGMKVEILLPPAAAAAAPATPPAAPEAPKKDGSPNSLLVPGST